MNRIKWIDLTRVIAILTVIFCHCLDNIYHIMDPHNVYSLSITSKIFVFTGYSIMTVQKLKDFGLEIANS